MASPKVDRYSLLLQSLLPRGSVWTKNQKSRLAQFLRGAAQELARMDDRADDLMLEIFPDTVNELLAQWEKDLDIPGPHGELGATTAERRSDIVAKEYLIGRLNIQYWEDLATDLGFTIVIETFRPSWVGLFSAGDIAANQDILYSWIVHEYNTGLSEERYEQLEYLFRTYKPAHTSLFFNEVAEFDQSFAIDFATRRIDFVRYQEGSFNEAFRSKDFDVFHENLEGAFRKDFSRDFDRTVGGDFTHDEFDRSFHRR